MRRTAGLIGTAFVLAASSTTSAWAQAPPPPRDYGSGVCAAAERGRFGDVPPSSEAASAVDCLASLGIVRGHADQTYRPGQVVDRASVAVHVGRTAEYLTFEAVFDDNALPPFRDVDEITREQFFYVQGLYNRAVVQGVGQDTYAPTRPVSRGQSAALLQRLHALVQDQALQDPPADLPAGEDYYSDDDESLHEQAINAVTAAGVTQGTGAGTFAPAEGLSRAQLALVLARYLQLVADLRP